VPLLTTKELSIIEEQIKAEDLAIAKCRHYMALTDDQETIKLLESMEIRHKDHRQTLVKHLKPNG
jgi:hypothetical protein